MIFSFFRKEKMVKLKNYTFTLSGVNLDNVYAKFGLYTNEFLQKDEIVPFQATMIEELNCNKSAVSISFIDESKNMCHSVAYAPNLNSTGKLSCFWCRNNIPKGIKPLGCPVRYVTNRISNTYYSEISKDKYSIKENITGSTFDKVLHSARTTTGKTEGLPTVDNFVLFNNGYYILEGAFCSFNCCVAFVQDNSENTLYKHSYTLLLQFYEDLFQEEVLEILPAPHWKKLLEYGGDLSIETFRLNFNKVLYNYKGTSIEIPKSVSIKHIFEERLRF